MRSINLPFMGFYYTLYDQLLDSELEQLVEHYTCPQEHPEEILDGPDVADALHGSADWCAMYEKIAKEYVDYFRLHLFDTTGVNLESLEFEEMRSPREYNFTTDRIFANISESDIQTLKDAVSPDSLAEMIKARHTSYDGFISFYSNDPLEWEGRDIGGWDANELSTLIRAFIKQEAEDEDWEQGIAVNMADDNLFSNVFDECVDWRKFESKLIELRDE